MLTAYVTDLSPFSVQPKGAVSGQVPSRVWGGTSGLVVGDEVRCEVIDGQLEVFTYGAGGILLPDGSATAPALSNIGDTNTGLYFPSADAIDVTLGGAREYEFYGAAFVPIPDNTNALGQPAYRWTTVYATTGTINTSDEAAKDDVADSDLGLDFILALRPVRYRFTDGVRPHYGLLARQVRKALDRLGHGDFGGYVDPAVKTVLPSKPVRAEFDDSPSYQAAVAGWRAVRDAPLGLRYSEFVAPLVRAVQQQQQQIDDLRGEVVALAAALRGREGKT